MKRWFIVIFVIIWTAAVFGLGYYLSGAMPAPEAAKSQIAARIPWNDKNQYMKADCDLNGDGLIDSISLNTDFYSENRCKDRFTLTINKVELSGEGECLTEYFGIVDINSADPYLEIAITEYGPSSDNRTYFYWYDGRKIRYIGTLEGLYDYMKFDGKGTIITETRGHILQTWFYPDRFHLTATRKLENVPQDLYEMGTKVKMLKSLALQRSRTDKTIVLTLEVGETVTIVSTDNKEWLLVRNSKGKLGWFALDEGGTIRGTNLIPQETFEGLCYAD